MEAREEEEGSDVTVTTEAEEVGGQEEEETSTVSSLPSLKVRRRLQQHFVEELGVKVTRDPSRRQTMWYTYTNTCDVTATSP